MKGHSRTAVLTRLSLLLTVAVPSLACGDHVQYKRAHDAEMREFQKRQSAYPSGPAYDVPPLANIVPTPVTYTENMLPVLQTYAPGSQPPLSGAPPLPTYAINPAQWPDLQSTPPTDSPEVKEWLKELEGHNIPNIPVNPVVDCGDPRNAAALAARGESGQCWWTCGGCTRDTDISQCKDEWEWGHTYDDGPGFYTNKLLTYLNSVAPNGESNIPNGVAPGLKATFFVVGARVISRPEIVVYEYMNNHEISGHTWSHSALTTLTNEQIVAELGWTRKAIKDVLGVTPLTFRPPYGDIDDRVRAVALAMGMRPVLWTGSMQGVPANGDPIQWDSQDWRVHSGDVNSTSNQASFENILNSSNQFADPSTASYNPQMAGVVVLQHDIYVESVNLAIGYTVPFANSHNPQFKLGTVTECQPRSDGSGKMSLRDAYVETNTDLGNPAWVALNQGTDNENSGVHLSTSVQVSGSLTRTLTYAVTGTETSSSSSAVGLRVGGLLAAGGVGLVGMLMGALML